MIWRICVTQQRRCVIFISNNYLYLSVLSVTVALEQWIVIDKRMPICTSRMYPSTLKPQFHVVLRSHHHALRHIWHFWTFGCMWKGLFDSIRKTTDLSKASISWLYHSTVNSQISLRKCHSAEHNVLIFRLHPFVVISICLHCFVYL